MTNPKPDARGPQQTPSGYVTPSADGTEVAERRRHGVGTVRIVCALSALVPAIHMLLVFGEANSQNGFAKLVNGWSSGVSLGLRDLFTIENVSARTLCNDGLAAILWLVIGTVATDLISRIGPTTPWWPRYRRAVR